MYYTKYTYNWRAHVCVCDMCIGTLQNVGFEFIYIIFYSTHNYDRVCGYRLTGWAHVIALNKRV